MVNLIYNLIYVSWPYKVNLSVLRFETNSGFAFLRSLRLIIFVLFLSARHSFAHDDLLHLSLACYINLGTIYPFAEMFLVLFWGRHIDDEERTVSPQWVTGAVGSNTTVGGVVEELPDISQLQANMTASNYLWCRRLHSERNCDVQRMWTKELMSALMSKGFSADRTLVLPWEMKLP